MHSNFRSEVLNIATEYATSLGLRDREHPLSYQWYADFMSRWPELKLLQPRGLEIQRAKATSLDCVTNYYNELNQILTKYDLHDKPERIYNVDEKGLSTSHKPPGVVAAVGTKPSAVTSGSRVLVTVLGCGNAIGYQVPPFFIFPGARMREELLEGKTPGTDGTVSDSGWSNSEIFREYVEHHLVKYLPERCSETPVLLLYDGHKSHINLGIIDWAKKEHIILFVLPAHTSHVLQPLDVGCFGPFERIFNNVSHRFMRENCGQSISRYNICSLACPAYVKALSPENLQSSFRQSGIYPFNPNAVDPSHFKPAEFLIQEESSCCPGTITETSGNPEKVSTSQTPKDFFTLKEKTLTDKKPKTKKRKYLSFIISGKAVTEDKIVSNIQEHEASKKKTKNTQKPTPTQSGKSAGKGGKHKKVPKNKETVTFEPTPGPSGVCRSNANVLNDSLSGVSSEDEDEKCCVCGKFTPDAVRYSESVIFTKWVSCDGCNHWTHLIYCTNVRVVRRGDSFFCPHCSPEE